VMVWACKTPAMQNRNAATIPRLKDFVSIKYLPVIVTGMSNAEEDEPDLCLRRGTRITGKTAPLP
jgi:hypothetical protein